MVRSGGKEGERGSSSCHNQLCFGYRAMNWPTIEKDNNTRKLIHLSVVYCRDYLTLPLPPYLQPFFSSSSPGLSFMNRTRLMHCYGISSEPPRNRLPPIESYPPSDWITEITTVQFKLKFVHVDNNRINFSPPGSSFQSQITANPINK